MSSAAGVVLRRGRGSNLPHMWHVTLFSKIKALACRRKNERSVAFKISQNALMAGASPQTPLGELTTLPRSPNRLGRGHPSPHPTSLGASIWGREIPPKYFSVEPRLMSCIHSLPEDCQRYFVTNQTAGFPIQSPSNLTWYQLQLSRHLTLKLFFHRCNTDS